MSAFIIVEFYMRLQALSSTLIPSLDEVISQCFFANGAVLVSHPPKVRFANYFA
jgi:hypothetical protein